MIHKLSSSKATGPDAISVKLLKMVSPVFSHPLPLIPEVFLACDGELRHDTCSAEGSLSLRLDRNRKPRMKSLCHPGYSSSYQAFQPVDSKGDVSQQMESGKNNTSL